MITLPVIAAVTPLASAAVGTGLPGEAPGTGLAGGAAAGLAVLIASLALAFLARSAPRPEPRNHRPAHRHRGGPAVSPGAARPGSAPFPTAGRRPPRPPASPGPSRLATHPHAGACRSSHPGTEATTAPTAQALSRTAAVPITAASGRNAVRPMFRSANVSLPIICLRELIRSFGLSAYTSFIRARAPWTARGAGGGYLTDGGVLLPLVSCLSAYWPYRQLVRHS
jgi:hypothetical protein